MQVQSLQSGTRTTDFRLKSRLIGAIRRRTTEARCDGSQSGKALHKVASTSRLSCPRSVIVLGPASQFSWRFTPNYLDNAWAEELGGEPYCSPPLRLCQLQVLTKKQKHSAFFGKTVFPERQCLKLLANTHRLPGGAGNGAFALIIAIAQGSVDTSQERPHFMRV